MSIQTLQMTDELNDYLLKFGVRDDDLLRSLREETARDPMAQMQISPEQGQFLYLLVKMLSARNILEVGTFTGYSALNMARALPDDGRLICCDISDEWTRIARRYWKQDGQDHKINLKLAPAAETLKGLLEDGKQRTFDFAFIDADKENYDTYYELCLKLMRPGGVIAFDNVLWSGAVVKPANNSESTIAIKALNRKLHDDCRVELSLLPIGDGLTLARKC